MNDSKSSCSIPEIKERLRKLSFDSFCDEEILGYERFRASAFSEICVSEAEYEATTDREGLLKRLIDELKDILDSLVLGGEEAAGVPPDELLNRNSVAAKIAYKRALYMVREERFCEAAMSTAFAVDYIADADPSLKDDPSGLAKPLRTMTMGVVGRNPHRIHGSKHICCQRLRLELWILSGSFINRCQVLYSGPGEYRISGYGHS